MNGDRTGRFIGQECPRLVVVQAEGPLGMRDARASVGAATFSRDGEWFVTVIVKLALGRGDGPLMQVLPAPPFFVDRPSRFAALDPTLLDHASDFALFKPAVDLLVVGHARATVPSAALSASLRLLSGDGSTLLSTVASLRAGAPTREIPLAAPYLSTAHAGAATRFAPSQNPARAVGGLVLPSLDPLLFQAASPELRLTGKPVIGLEAIVTEGLSEGPRAGAAERLQLPGLSPVVTWDGAEEGNELATRLDTIHLDADAGQLTATWRGVIGPLSTPDAIRRLVVSLDRIGVERSAGERLVDTQRGDVHFAWTEDDAARGEPPPKEHPLLDLHRYLSWGEVAPEPRVPLETYAKVSAEVAEWPDRRSQTLERHGFSDARWMIEERAWLERFAANAVDGRGELVAHFGELFVVEQDALKSAEEDAITLQQYVALKLSMARAGDVAEILAQAKLRLAQWLRIDRAWTSLAEADPEVAAALDAAALAAGADEGWDALADDEADEDDEDD